jgi:membrane-associated phospholipid phosphatase
MNPHTSFAPPRTAAASFAAVALVFSACYWLSNRLTHVRADVGTAVFEWERSIPFVEWTIVPYLSIVPFFVASFFVAQQRHELRQHAARLLALLLIALACYAAFPLRFTFARPETSGLTGLLFELLSTVDQPYNRAPSLHIGVLVVLWARFSSALAGFARFVVLGWFVLIGVSVLTTYQHHVVDVPAGFLAGWLCVLWRRTAAPTPRARPLSSPCRA